MMDLEVFGLCYRVGVTGSILHSNKYGNLIMVLTFSFPVFLLFLN